MFLAARKYRGNNQAYLFRKACEEMLCRDREKKGEGRKKNPSRRSCPAEQQPVLEGRCDIALRCNAGTILGHHRNYNGFSAIESVNQHDNSLIVTVV